MIATASIAPATTSQAATTPARPVTMAAGPVAVSGDDVDELAELRRTAAAVRADRARRAEQPPAPTAPPPVPSPPAPQPVKTTVAASAPKPRQADDRADVVVAYARRQVGKPYSYGAAGPGSYDCSGLTMRAYEQVGIRLGHYTGSQMGAGRRVGRGELRPGDLVFPSSEHVGIYVGGDRIIHAPQPGDRVKTSRLWSFYTARRLL